MTGALLRFISSGLEVYMKTKAILLFLALQSAFFSFASLAQDCPPTTVAKYIAYLRSLEPRTENEYKMDAEDACAMTAYAQRLNQEVQDTIDNNINSFAPNLCPDLGYAKTQGAACENVYRQSVKNLIDQCTTLSFVGRRESGINAYIRGLQVKVSCLEATKAAITWRGYYDGKKHKLPALD